MGRITKRKPVRVLAMPPFDSLIEPALRKVAPNARLEITSWPTDGLPLAKIEAEAKSKVRSTKQDLVLLAVPRSATADSREAFASSYGWVMNWSLNFGPPTWDVVVIHPDVHQPAADQESQDDLVRQLVRAQDLSLIDRPAGNTGKPEEILHKWLVEQAAAAARNGR